jgi:hypothetical protein
LICNVFGAATPLCPMFTGKDVLVRTRSAPYVEAARGWPARSSTTIEVGQRVISPKYDNAVMLEPLLDENEDRGHYKGIAPDEQSWRTGSPAHLIVRTNNEHHSPVMMVYIAVPIIPTVVR